jgi:hypothetical protein
MNNGVLIGLGLIGLGILAMWLLPDPRWQLAEAALVMAGCLISAATLLPGPSL